jgi:hypothetical protein
MPKRLLLIMLVLVMMLFIAVSASADEKTGGDSGGNAVGYTQIVGSPLTINVATDASYQVIHDIVDPLTPGQVYPTSAEEADAGLFLWFGGVAVGPDFNNHESGSASNDYSPWVNTSQSAVLGTGTSADPWIVETDVENISTGATMAADTIYVNGDDYFRIDWEICTATSGAASTFLAADYYLQGSDDGYGYYDASTGSVGGFNELQDWFQIFTPVTPPSAYYEGYYGSVWDLIGSSSVPGSGFNNSIDNTLVDNGAGLQWDFTGGGCTEFRSFWSFGDTPVLPPTSVALADFDGGISANYTLVFAGVLAILFVIFLVARYQLVKNRS